MQTISINFIVPQDRYKLDDSQLRYGYDPIAKVSARDVAKKDVLIFFDKNFVTFAAVDMFQQLTSQKFLI